MTTYISIADDITDLNIQAIHKAKGDVVIVHSICTTIAGRKLLARKLKRRGCRPEVVHTLGWATSNPNAEADSKACSQSPSLERSPASPEALTAAIDKPVQVTVLERQISEPLVPREPDAPMATSKSSRRKRKRTTPSDS